MLPSERLISLGLELPTDIKAMGAYVVAKKVGPHVFTSGQVPMVDGKVVTGRLGAGMDVAAGREAARLAALRALACAALAAEHIDEIREIIKVTVFVNSAPSFTDQPQVANGASEVLIDIFGDAGRHVRSAIGVAALPSNAAVEIELVVGL